jgi:hypothetical protein
MDSNEAMTTKKQYDEYAIEKQRLCGWSFTEDHDAHGPSEHP